MGSRFLTPCGGGSNYLKRCQGPSLPPLGGSSSPSGIYLQPCATCDWFALIYICAPMQCYPPPPGSYYAPIQGKVTVRSQKPVGTVLNVNVDQSATAGCGWTYLKSDCVTFAQLTGNFNITVGLDTGGQWQYLTSIVVAGQPTLYVFINAFNASTESADLQYCTIPEFGLPVASELVTPHAVVTEFGGVVLATTNPGPIKWQDVVAPANAIAGTGYVTDDECRHQPFGTIVPPGYYNSAFTMALFDGSVAQFGLAYPIDTIDWFAAHVATNKACYGPFSFGSQNDGVISGRYTRRVYQKPIFSCPATVPTDTIGFNLPISFKQFYSGSTVDGTHVWDNTQETDQDTVPGLELDSPIDSCEFILWNSTTRNSFGNYTINNLQFVCRAPSTRRINVWAHRQFTGGQQAFRNNPWKQQSTDIAVTIGPADCVDVIRTQAGTNHYGLPPVKAGSAILGVGGAALRARVLDICGETCDFNVVPTATNSITAALGSSGTNFFASPTLHGTNPKSAVAGLADFSDLYILGAGRHYKLTFTAAGLFTGANGNFFDEISIYPDLVFESLPALNAGINASIKVDLKDSLGAALVPSTADSLTLSGDGGFTGYGTVAPVAGVATFTGNFPAAGSFAMQVVTSGFNYDGPGVSGIASVTITATVNP